MRIIDDPVPDPRTGMRGMAAQIESGDHVVLITGDSKRVVSEPIIVGNERSIKFKVPWKAGSNESIGWAVVTVDNEIIGWSWIEGAKDIRWGDFIEVHLDW
jgi:hypothetical protein